MTVLTKLQYARLCEIRGIYAAQVQRNGRWETFFTSTNRAETAQVALAAHRQWVLYNEPINPTVMSVFEANRRTASR